MDATHAVYLFSNVMLFSAVIAFPLLRIGDAIDLSDPCEQKFGSLLIALIVAGIFIPGVISALWVERRESVALQAFGYGMMALHVGSYGYIRARYGRLGYVAPMFALHATVFAIVYCRYPSLDLQTLEPWWIAWSLIMSGAYIKIIRVRNRAR